MPPSPPSLKTPPPVFCAWPGTHCGSIRSGRGASTRFNGLRNQIGATPSLTPDPRHAAVRFAFMDAISTADPNAGADDSDKKCLCPSPWPEDAFHRGTITVSQTPDLNASWYKLRRAALLLRARSWLRPRGCKRVLLSLCPAEFTRFRALGVQRRLLAEGQQSLCLNDYRIRHTGGSLKLNSGTRLGEQLSAGSFVELVGQPYRGRQGIT